MTDTKKKTSEAEANQSDERKKTNEADANQNDQSDSNDSDAGFYRFTGNKVGHDGTSRIIVEGTSANPEKFLDLNGDPVELDKDQVAELRDRHNLQRLKDDEVNKFKREQESGKGRRGSDQLVAGGATGPAASAAADRRVGGPGAGKQ